MARKVDISELYSVFLLKSNSLLNFEYVSNEAPFFSQDVYVWAPYSAFLSTQNGPFHVMSATPPPPPPLPLRYREILKGREGVSKVIYEGVTMSVALISKKHLPF